MKLFIDDLRNAPDSTWVVARTSDDAIAIIAEGIPQVISFDHDLGGLDTAMKVVNFIMESVLDGYLVFPIEFLFTVHSANPVGAENITVKMNNLLNFVEG